MKEIKKCLSKSVDFLLIVFLCPSTFMDTKKNDKHFQKNAAVCRVADLEMLLEQECLQRFV